MAWTAEEERFTQRKASHFIVAMTARSWIERKKKRNQRRDRGVVPLETPLYSPNQRAVSGSWPFDQPSMAKGDTGGRLGTPSIPCDASRGVA